MKILSVRDLSLQLGGRTILEQVNLELEAGAFQLVIGPNGAGKSSLLKCILGLHNYSGEVFLDGKNCRELNSRARARIVAYVPQFLNLHFNLDVRSLLSLSRFAHDDTEPGFHREVIEDALERTHATHLADAFMDELSGGERQRVLIAAALAQRPRLLILDEPSTAMDPGHRRDLAALLERLHDQENLSILVVTHDWNEFTRLKPDVLALKGGKVAFQCAHDALEGHLEALFECKFHHFEADGQRFSTPKL